MSNTVIDDTEWYAVRTKPMEEDRAALNLSGWQVPIFFPKLKERRASGFGSQYVTRPLFSNYLFARFNAVRQLHKINFTRGVRSVVSFAGHPIPIEDEIIDLIKNRLDENGFVRLDEDLKPGDRVRINAGPFQTLGGVFQESTNNDERVKILLDAMACQSHLVIPRELIDKVN